MGVNRWRFFYLLLFVVMGVPLMFKYIERYQIDIAMLILIILIIATISVVAFEYWKFRKQKGT